MSDPGNSDLEKELYYLVAKFLENGPCHEAAEVLKQQLNENKLIIPRKDWEGREHERTFDEYNHLNSHVQRNHLLELSKRLSSLEGVSTPQSARRSITSILSFQNEDSTKKAPDLQTVARYSSVHHSKSLIPSSKLKVTSITSLINGQSNSGVKSQFNISRNCNVYSKFSMHKRILGHLASVYCVLFDQTGSVIITGADDKLLKLWSAKDGRLVETFRGHAGQITDIAINKGNSFIASGSLDKAVRVWNLHNTHPVAVLQGHIGTITSIKYCPCSHPDTRYLVSTGTDGQICFWAWYPKSGEYNLTPIKFNEKTRNGVQMLCTSFSPGGSFLTTGSSDNYIRVYQLYPEPEKIAELPNHSDHVDSIIYSNFGSRFLSGSRDGTAMIWSFQAGEWLAKQLDCSKPVKGEKVPEEEESRKLKVTMICWSANDKYVITAGTDSMLRIWDSYTATFVNYLKGHSDNVYVIEAHPFLDNLLLSAGHDGKVFLWDIENCCQVKMFFNMLEGQGHGAIFDCKFSPTGLQFTATDSHGHLLIFGLGSDDRFQKVPYEQFFHTDYREIIRDSNNYVLDSQLQTAPHLMPPPYLVDVDGNPHPSQYQMLIPGRTQRNLPQRRQQQPVEELPPLLAEIEAAERNLRSPGPNNRRHSVSADGLLSPGGGVGLRESGDVEGVRQENNLYVSGDITDADAEAWRNRTIVPVNTLYNQSESDRNRYQHSINEITNYANEKRKQELKESESDNRPTLRSATRGRGRGRGRSGRQAKPTVVYVRPSALRTLDYIQPYEGGDTIHLSSDEAEDWQGESSESSDDSDWENEATAAKEATARSKRRRGRNLNAVKEEEAENESDGEDIEQNSSSDSSDQSTSSSEEEGDGEEEARGGPSTSGKRKAVRKPRRKRKKVVIQDGSESSGNDSNSSDDNEGDNDNKQPRRSTRKAVPKLNHSPVRQKKPLKKKVKKEIKTKKPLPSVENLDEYLSVYAPPEWLLNVETKKFPYFPQYGDEVYYLRQGHHLYVEEVIKQNEYDIVEIRQAYRRYDLAPAELCRLIGITYDVGPPKNCSLKLELIGKQKSSGGRRTITVRFHDMPNVVDFLVLKHIYEDSLQQEWKENDRFRCIIDDTWYYGQIMEVSPLSEEFLTSSFLSLVVKWDSGDDERVSPWDLEKIPEGAEEVEETVNEEDKKLFEYTPTPQDWPNESVEELQNRAVQALESFSCLEICGPFAYPVDARQYPTYWGTIAFPTDLETIRNRLSNGFYRRIEALLWEVRQLRHNAVKFNEEGSGIVQNANLIVKILCRFLKDPELTDIIALYNEVTSGEQVEQIYYEDDQHRDESDEDEEDEEIDVGQGSSGAGCSSSGSSLSQTWITHAKSLLEFISSRDDAQPFLEPVDLEQYTDYGDVISEPMDISTIRHRLDNNQYDSAEAYIRDFQLMFRNSKTYNTDRRSNIFKMTLRLSALFEDRCGAVREAFNIASENVHMTRRRVKTLNSINTPTEQLVDNTNKVRNGSYNSSGEDGEKSTTSSGKVPNRITLSNFVRPATRSRKANSEESTPGTSENPKNTRKRTSNENIEQSSETEEEIIEEDSSSDSNSEGSELEKNQKLTTRKSQRKKSLSESEKEMKVTVAARKPQQRRRSQSSSESSSEEREKGDKRKEKPDLKFKLPVRKSKRRRSDSLQPKFTNSGRPTFKRARYGFDSEENDETSKTTPAKKKKMTNGKIPAATTSLHGEQKPLSNGVTFRRTARKKAAVSYCEDDNYENFDDAFEEPHNGQNDSESSSNNSSSSNEEDSNSDSETSENNDNVPVAGVSSRGRVRRPANRYL